jgi:GTP-binding protein
LGKAKQVIALNKADIADTQQIDKFRAAIKLKTILISAATGQGLSQLNQEVYSQLLTIPPDDTPLELFTYPERDTMSFEIERHDDASFEIYGAMIDELARNVVLDDIDSYKYFQKKLKDNGIMRSLKDYGAKDGDKVKIMDFEFEYFD